MIANIEKATRKQSKESLRYKFRSDILTASNHHDISTKTNIVTKDSGAVKPKTTPTVAKVIYNDGKIENHLWNGEWLNENEENAFKNYLCRGSFKTPSIKGTEMCVFLEKIKSFIAASPDGTVTCKCYGKGLIQIKWLYRIRDKKTSESVTECDFLVINDNGRVPLSRKPKYCTQVISKWQLQRQCFAIL